MDCHFSFGPNRSYFCSADSFYAWSHNALPTELARILEDKTHSEAMGIPHDVALAMEPGSYVMCWKTAAGKDRYEDGYLDQNYARLARFVKNVAATGAHTIRTTFGPGTSYFSMSPSGCSWQNLPPGLEDDIQNCINIRRPTCVALGVHGSYVVIYNDRTLTFDLRGQYPLAEAMIRNTQEASCRGGVGYIALNPSVSGEYYAVYGDGGASWNFPTVWTKDVLAVSQQIRPFTSSLAGASRSETPPSPAPPSYAGLMPAIAPKQTPSPSAPHKITWQEGLSVGLKTVAAVHGVGIVLPRLKKSSHDSRS